LAAIAQGSGRRETNVRAKTLVILVVVVMAVLLAPQGAFADKPRFTCPPGLDLGGLTLEQALLLPNVQAGLAAGVFTEADLTITFDGVDHNDDGLVCFKSYSGNASLVSQQQYAYNIADNNASKPSG
jgi:hypothetical protein